MKKPPRKPVVQFASDSFRVLTPETLTEAEWNFTPLAEDNYETACRALDYELARECECEHRLSADYVRLMKDKNGFARLMQTPIGIKLIKAFPLHALWPSIPNSWNWIFPAPFLTMPKGERGWAATTKCNTIKELDADTFAMFEKTGLRYTTSHRIVIEWINGKGHAKAELLKWFDAIANLPPLPEAKRTRPLFQLVKDAFAQLSAWRARRAGLSDDEYRTLVAKAGIKVKDKKTPTGFVRPYRDPSAFRTAANGGQKSIAEMNAHITFALRMWRADVKR